MKVRSGGGQVSSASVINFTNGGEGYDRERPLLAEAVSDPEPEHCNYLETGHIAAKQGGAMWRRP